MYKFDAERKYKFPKAQERQRKWKAVKGMRVRCILNDSVAYEQVVPRACTERCTERCTEETGGRPEPMATLKSYIVGKLSSRRIR